MDNEIVRAKAQRLMALVQSPGWPDLVNILSELNSEAAQAVRSFQGWDKDQKCSMVDRAQAVDGTVQQVIARVNAFIVAGSQMDVHNTSEDGLPAETRIPGTY